MSSASCRLKCDHGVLVVGYSNTVRYGLLVGEKLVAEIFEESSDNVPEGGLFAHDSIVDDS